MVGNAQHEPDAHGTSPDGADLTIACDCGHLCRFEEDDRGFEIYCDSCGRVVTVPAAPDASSPAGEPAAPPSSVGDRIDAEQDESGGSSVDDAGTFRAVSARSTESSVGGPRRTPAARKSARAEIFSASGVASIQDEQVGEVRCLCGASVPVQLGDYGAEIYCPSCGAGLSTGRPVPKSPPAPLPSPSTKEEPAVHEPAGTEDAGEPVRRSFVPMAVAASVVVVALGAALVLVLKTRGDSPNDLSIWPPPTNPPNRGVTKEGFDPREVTTKAIERLFEESHPFEAIGTALTWKHALRSPGISEQDPRFAQLDRVCQRIVTERSADMQSQVEELLSLTNPADAADTAQQWRSMTRALEMPDNHPVCARLDEVIALLLQETEPVTIDRIQSLLSRPDAGEALATAQVWRERLVLCGLPADDVRLAELAIVERELQDRLTPPPIKPPPAVADVQAILAEAETEIEAGRFELARASLENAQRRIDEQASELAPFACRVDLLRARLERAERVETRIDEIRMIISQAKQAAAAGDVLAAAEGAAKARFLARRTPMAERHAEDLRANLAALESEVRFARGKQAVENAVQLHRDGDIEARDREVRRAYAILPGIHNERISPLLQKIKTWKNLSYKARERVADMPPASPAAHRIAAQDKFAEILDHYAAGREAEFLEAALNAHHQWQDGQKYYQELDGRLGQIVLEMITRKIRAAVRYLDPIRDSQQLRGVLETTRQQHEQAAAWGRSQRWQSLGELIRRQLETVSD